jgi:pyrimidine-nucleoside phosphorylase
MLLAADRAPDIATATALIRQTITDGSALAKFAEFIAAQGGDPDYVHHPGRLPVASLVEPLIAPCAGFIEQITCDAVGHCSLILGGGRLTKDSPIDLTAGILLNKKVGDPVDKGEPLAWLHANDQQKLSEAKSKLLKAYKFSDKAVNVPSLVKGFIT